MDQSGATAAGSTRSFLVTQGDQQYPLEPFGNGKTIETFYRYGEHGHAHSNPEIGIERSNVSVLFFWTGPEGISLVIIHDKPHDIEGGGEVEFTFENLPEAGNWVVRDDDPGNDTYSKTEIDWQWTTVNTDGAAFRGGLTEVEEITIRPNFQEGINEWQLLTGDLHDPTSISLDLEEPIRISPGSVVDSLSSTLDELDDTFGDGVDSGRGGSVQAARGQLMRSLVNMSDNLAVLFTEEAGLKRDVARDALESIQSLREADADLGGYREEIMSSLTGALAAYDVAIQHIDQSRVSPLQFGTNLGAAATRLRSHLSQSSDVYFSDRGTALDHYDAAYSQVQEVYRTFLRAQSTAIGPIGGAEPTAETGPTALSEAIPSGQPGTLRRLDRLLVSFNRSVSLAVRLLFLGSRTDMPGPSLESRIFGGNRQGSVLIEGEVYAVYDEVPGYPPDSHAFTHIDGTLLEPDRAVDVAIGFGFSDSYAFDSRSRLQRAREHHEKFENIEDMARAANILAELSGAVALAKIDHKASISHAAAAVEGVLEWGEYEIDNPYREQFAKMAATGSTMTWADREVPEPSGSLLSISEDALEVGQTMLDASAAVGGVTDVVSGASTVRNVINQADTVRTDVPTSQVDGIGDLKSASYTVVAGLAVDAVVGAATNVAESLARQAALGAGSTGARKAVLHDIVSLERQIDGGGLGPMGVFRLQSLKQTDYQMEAAAWEGIGSMQQQLSNGALGPAYDAMLGTENMAEQAFRIAETYRNLGHFTMAQTGREIERALDRYEKSVNAAQFGDQTVFERQ